MIEREINRMKELVVEMKKFPARSGVVIKMYEEMIVTLGRYVKNEF